MLAGVGMKCGNLCDFRCIPSACLQDKHAKAILCQISSKRPAARPGAYYNKVVLCCLLFWVKSGVSHFNEDKPQPQGSRVLECFEEIDQVVELLFAQVFGKIVAAIQHQIGRGTDLKKPGCFFAFG